MCKAAEAVDLERTNLPNTRQCLVLHNDRIPALFPPSKHFYIFQTSKAHSITYEEANPPFSQQSRHRKKKRMKKFSEF